MADELDDGEFWLPSHFLTDDDILMDFGFSSTTHGGATSDSGFTESDDDDTSSCPVHSKVLSSSPQSTLYGCICNQSSSRESETPVTAQEEDKTTIDVLKKAVLKLKINNNNNNNKKVVGTGFFDCTQKRVTYPPPPPPPPQLQPGLFFPAPPQFLRFPSPPHSMVWPPSNALQQNQQPLQNRGIKNENKSNTSNNNRPLGLPPSAWPPLQAQAQGSVQGKAQSQPMPALVLGPPKGTGVFLPRVATTTPAADQPRKKDANTTTKSKSGKASQPQSNQRRNSGNPSTTSTMTTATNHNDIQLPQEWTY